jgi:hypothetical protein
LLLDLPVSSRVVAQKPDYEIFWSYILCVFATVGPFKIYSLSIREINDIFSIFGEQFLISVNHVRIKVSFSSF